MVAKQRIDNARRLAAKILLRVIVRGESFGGDSFERYTFEPEIRAAASEIVYGVLRWRWRLEAVLGGLLQRSIRKRDSDIKLQLLIGLYQLLYMRTPEYAAVDQTVSEVRALKKSWATAMANAVMRNFIRRRAEILEALGPDESGFYSHPQWLIDCIRNDWPDCWQEILEANNRRAPMWLRINRHMGSVDQYQKLLEQQGIAVAAVCRPDSVALREPVDVSSLPEFDRGRVSVQDGGAQNAALLMACRAGDRVLDACTAPGGKACHMLEIQPDIAHLAAVDADEKRLLRVTENLARLSLEATLHCADLCTDTSWWDGQLFDRILLDAPCSATGVIRRHPDIKSLRRREDIEALSQTQAAILKRLWPMLKPGGRLLYVTCSVLKQENETRISALLLQFSDACEIVLEVENSMTCKHGKQILPGSSDRDGYYFACVQKQVV